jgi:hypothetical protein
MRQAMVAAFLLAAACTGGGGGEDWMKAKRVEASGLASGIAFTIQVPEGFAKAGDDKYPEWKTDKIGFQVSSTEELTSMEAAIAKISAPGAQYHVEKQERLPDGFLIRRLSEPEKPGVVFVDVFKSTSSRNLLCHGSAQAGGRTFDDLPGTLDALEAVCRSMTVK